MSFVYLVCDFNQQHTAVESVHKTFAGALEKLLAIRASFNFPEFRDFEITYDEELATLEYNSHFGSGHYAIIVREIEEEEEENA